MIFMGRASRRLYADLPVVRTRQLLGDLGVVVWCGVWVRIALTVQQRVQRLGAPGRALEQAGSGLAGGLDSAEERARSLPLVGGALAEPFGRAAGAGRLLVAAGQAQQDAVDNLALLAATALVVLPVAWLVARWLPRRRRWVRDARSARRLLATGAALDVLAARAIASQPLDVLARLGPDTLRGWAAAEPAAVATVAEVALRSLGLRSGR